VLEKDRCNTSMMLLEEESPPASLRIMLNILISGFFLISGNSVSGGANA
jgi:hypothetical protein